MNILDLIIAAVVALCMLVGYRRGLIHTLFRLVSFFLSIVLTSRLYPYVSRFLAGTALHTRISDMVTESLGLKELFNTHAAQQAAELIDALPLPDVLRDLLMTHNTPDMYELLKVSTIEEYIGGFFANMAINVIAIIGVFILVWLALGLIGGLLDVIGHLPIIHTLNRLGGVAMGLIMGVAVVWLGVTLLSFLFATPANPSMYQLLQESFVADWLFNNNQLLKFITNIG